MQIQTEASTRKGILLMLAALLLFTAMDALAKGLVQDYPTTQVIWARFAGQVLLVLLIVNRSLPTIARTHHPWPHPPPPATHTGRDRLLALPHWPISDWPRQRRLPISTPSSSRWARRSALAKSSAPAASRASLPP